MNDKLSTISKQLKHISKLFGKISEKISCVAPLKGKILHNQKQLMKLYSQLQKSEHSEKLIIEFHKKNLGKFNKFANKSLFPLLKNEVIMFAEKALTTIHKIKAEKELSNESSIEYRNNYLLLYSLLNPFLLPEINIQFIIENIFDSLNIVDNEIQISIFNSCSSILELYKKGNKLKYHIDELNDAVKQYLGLDEINIKIPSQELTKCPNSNDLTTISFPSFLKVTQQLEDDSSRDLMQWVNRSREMKEAKLAELISLQAQTNQIRRHLEMSINDLKDIQNGKTFEDLVNERVDNKNQISQKITDLNNKISQEKDKFDNQLDEALGCLLNYADLVSQFSFYVKHRNENTDDLDLPDFETQQNLLVNAVSSEKRPTLSAIQPIVDDIHNLST